jgi:hypothetical protein
MSSTPKDFNRFPSNARIALTLRASVLDSSPPQDFHIPARVRESVQEENQSHTAMVV